MVRISPPLFSKISLRSAHTYAYLPVNSPSLRIISAHPRVYPDRLHRVGLNGSEWALVYRRGSRSYHIPVESVGRAALPHWMLRLWHSCICCGGTPDDGATRMQAHTQVLAHRRLPTLPAPAFLI